MEVSSIVRRYQRGMTSDEILDAFPHITPAQLHDVLSYYYDHQEEIDRLIAQAEDEEYWMAKHPPGKGTPARKL